MAQGKKLDPEMREQIITYLATCDNIRETARKFKVSPNTVKNIRDGMPEVEKDAFAQLRTDKKSEFIRKSWDLMTDGLDEMKSKMKEATYRDLATGIGIITDKMLLISGEATSRSDNNNKNTHELGELTGEQAEALIQKYLGGS